MRIVCWNTEYKRESWCFLCECHGQADVALLQEACTPPEEIAGRLDVGPGPWIHKGWNGARSVVRISNRVRVERVSVEDVIASVPSGSVIDSPARLAAGVVTLPGGERIGLVSVESAGECSERVPTMILEVQRYCEKHCCGAGLPFIVGADLTTWWDSDTTVFGEMMRIGLPMVGARTRRRSTADPTAKHRLTQPCSLTTCSPPGRSPTASPSKRSTTQATGAPATTAASPSTCKNHNPL